MFKKWIIYKNKFYLGTVNLHKELTPGYKDIVKGLFDTQLINRKVYKEIKPHVLGGGFWEYDAQQNCLFLYGSSVDFGSISRFDVLQKQIDWEEAKNVGVTRIFFFEGELNELLRDTIILFGTTFYQTVNLY